MTSQIPPEVWAALLAVLGALLTYLTTLTHQHQKILSGSGLTASNNATVMQSGNVEAAKTVSGLASSAIPARSSLGAAITLPPWNQLNDPLPNGSQDAYSTSDCGEECVAEIVYATKGVQLSAGDVRFSIGGANRPGLTSGLDLVAALALSGIPAVTSALDGPSAWQAIGTAISTGHPVIMLGNWLGYPALHWCVATSLRGEVIHFNDPWGGLRRIEPRQWFYANYSGQVVIVQIPVMASYIG